jgi:hypothetical protein
VLALPGRQRIPAGAAVNACSALEPGVERDVDRREGLRDRAGLLRLLGGLLEGGLVDARDPARVVSVIPVMAQPPSCDSNRTRASVSTDSGVLPPSASIALNCMEKQPACAAAMSSSGFVPGPSSIRERNE